MTDVALDPKALEKAAKAAYEGVYPSVAWSDSVAQEWWLEYAKIISELRPKYVLVENVSALLSRGLGQVLGDLADIGYDAEWHCIPASAVGAEHERERIWIVAYPQREGLEGYGRSEETCTPRIKWPSAKFTQIDSFYVRGCSDPSVLREDYGFPNRVDRISALGNAVVPQIPEILGYAILEAEKHL